MTAEIEYVDRYGTGGVGPDPDTMCKGQCEGTGVYPEAKDRNPDGSIPTTTIWEFITCPECGGTGKASKPD